MTEVTLDPIYTDADYIVTTEAVEVALPPAAALVEVGVDIPGPKGDQGIQGQDGGAYASANYRLASQTVVPPSSGQIRINVGATELYVHEQDYDGFDRTFGITQIAANDTLSLRFANGQTAIVRATGVAVDNGTYWTVPITTVTGAPEANRNQMTLVTLTIPGTPGPQGPPGADSTVPGPQGEQGEQGDPGPQGPGPTNDVVILTQAAYNALSPPVATTLYVIVG